MNRSMPVQAKPKKTCTQLRNHSEISGDRNFSSLTVKIRSAMPATKIHANFQRISGGRGSGRGWVMVAMADVR